MKTKKLNLIWTGVLILIIASQWALWHYNLVDRIFSSETKGDGREVAYWVAPMDPNYTSDKPGKSPMGMDLVPVYKDELPGQEKHHAGSEGVAGVDYYYTCGMHPNVHELEPGDCPICGMKLVKKNVTGAGNPGQVSIDPVTVQNMGVLSVPVEYRRLSRTIRTVGTVTWDERREASVTAKVSGWAEKLYVDFTGQSVRKGDPLMELYSPELVSTQEEYLQALEYAGRFKSTEFPEAVRQSEQLIKTTRNRLRLWDISDEQIDRLETTKKVKKTLTLYSPKSGVVTHKGLEEGDRVMPNMHLYRISSLSKVWVLADIYEYEIPWIKTGQNAEITLSYLPDRHFDGVISFIYPFLDKKSRTVKVRFEFDNPEGVLKPDMYADIAIHLQLDTTSLAVPVSAVILSGERSLVILDLGGGKFEPREVGLGLQAGNYYSITRGLHGGEKVVVSAQFLIDSESRLREAQMKMLHPEKADSVKSTVTLIGDGEMEYTCPMPEDMVFSSHEGKCPECGMKLVRMTPGQNVHMKELIKNHEVKHVQAQEQAEKETVKKQPEEGGTKKMVTLIGDGEMEYTCPMPEDMVFSDKPGDCPVCGMHLTRMKPEDHEQLKNLKQKHMVMKR